MRFMATDPLVFDVNTPYRRPLSPGESMFAAFSTTVTSFAQIRGALDISALSVSWELLVREYPVLRSKIEASDGAFELVLDPQFAAPPLRCSDEGADFEPFPPITPGQPLSSAMVFSSGSEHVVAVAFHHAIADGELMLFWLHRLWRQYGRVVEGDLPQPDPRPIPVSPLVALRSRGWGPGGRSCFHRIADLPRHAYAVPPSSSPGADAYLCNSAVARLKGAEAAHVREVCRARSVTSSGVAAAAIAVAERELLAGEGELPVGLTSNVNLRQRVSPAVAPDEVTNLAGYSIAKLAVRPGDDLCELASRINAQLHEDLAEGVSQRTECNMEEFLQAWAQHPNLEPIATSVLKLPPPPHLGGGLKWIRSLYRESVDYSALAPPEGQPFRPSLARRHAICLERDEWQIRTTYPAAVLSASQTQDFADRVKELLLAL
jgi:hypothetical protein